MCTGWEGKSVEEIEEIIGKVTIHSKEYAGIVAPGMLKSHYSPAKKVEMFDAIRPGVISSPTRSGALVFKIAHPGIPEENQYILSDRGDLKEAGKNLFTGLRWLDSLDIDIIYAEKVPDHGIGRAVNDRLKRAAAKL